MKRILSDLDNLHRALWVSIALTIVCAGLWAASVLTYLGGP